MHRLLLLALCLLFPLQITAGERVVGVNSYVRKIETWPLDQQGGQSYWRQNHFGSFKMQEGPLKDGVVECIGAGFSGPSGVRGEGICLYEDRNGDSFNMIFTVVPGEMVSWQIVSGTGQLTGIKGKGTTTSRVLSEFVALQHYESTWTGEITLPE